MAKRTTKTGKPVAYRAGRRTWGAIKTIRTGRKTTKGGRETKGTERFQPSYLRKAPGDPYDGVRVYGSSFDTRGDAEEWLREQDAATKHGTINLEALAAAEAAKAPKPIKFHKFATSYIDTRRHPRNGAKLKPSTLAGYRRLLEVELAAFHDLELAAVTPDMVRDWYEERTATGKLTQAARAYGFLRAVLAQAVEDRRIERNPAAIRGASKAKTGKRVEPPTDAELAIITATIDPRFSLMVEVAAWGGLRFGELTELRRGDVEFSGDDDALAIVHVARAVTQPTGAGFVIGLPKSSAGIRSVALPSMLTPALRAHLDTLQRGDNALLWPSTKDEEEHLSNGSFYGFWIAARAAAGRPDLPFHALRHYGLTRYAQTGATTKDLMARAGHNDVTTAMRYQHAASERDAELARRMTA